MATTCVARGYKFGRNEIYAPDNWGSDCTEDLARILGDAVVREFERAARELYGPSVWLSVGTSEVIADLDADTNADRLVEILQDAHIHVYEHMAEILGDAD